MFLGCSLAACVYNDPSSVKVSEIQSDQEIRNLICQFFYLHPMNLKVLEDFVLDGESGYDLGYMLIAMPLYPQEKIDQRTFWDKIKEYIGIT